MNNSAKILFCTGCRLVDYYSLLHKIEFIIQEKNYRTLLVTMDNCLR